MQKPKIAKSAPRSKPEDEAIGGVQRKAKTSSTEGLERRERDFNLYVSGANHDRLRGQTKGLVHSASAAASKRPTPSSATRSRWKKDTDETKVRLSRNDINVLRQSIGECSVGSSATQGVTSARKQGVVADLASRAAKLNANKQQLLLKMLDALEQGGESAEVCLDLFYGGESTEITPGAPRYLAVASSGESSGDSEGGDADTAGPRPRSQLRDAQPSVEPDLVLGHHRTGSVSSADEGCTRPGKGLTGEAVRGRVDPSPQDPPRRFAALAAHFDDSVFSASGNFSELSGGPPGPPEEEAGAPGIV
eukprot:RCo008636